MTWNSCHKVDGHETLTPQKNMSRYIIYPIFEQILATALDIFTKKNNLQCMLKIYQAKNVFRRSKDTAWGNSYLKFHENRMVGYWGMSWRNIQINMRRFEAFCVPHQAIYRVVMHLLRYDPVINFEINRRRCLDEKLQNRQISWI